jgi:hypothetical protein
MSRLTQLVVPPTRPAAQDAGSRVTRSSWSQDARRAADWQYAASPALLRVGPVDDVLEREAHAISEQFLRGELPTRPTARAPAREPTIDDSTAATIRGFEGSGAPLEARLQSSFGRQLGFDFSRVRVHHDTTAASSARALGARAFTVGPHVAFAAGQFAPETLRGRALLAHELVHVAQQRGASPRLGYIQRAPDGDSQPVPAEKTSETLEAAYRRQGDERRANAIRRCRVEGQCGRVMTYAQLRALYDLAKSSGGDEAKIRAGLAGPAFAGLGFVSASATGGTSAAVSTAAAGANAAAGTGAAGSGAAAAGGGATGITGAVIAGVALAALVAVLLAVSLYEEYSISKLRNKVEDLGYTVVLDEPLGVCIRDCHTSAAPRPIQFEPRLPGVGQRFPYPPTLGPEEVDQLRRWLDSAPESRMGPDATPAPRTDDENRRRKSCATEHPTVLLCDSPALAAYRDRGIDQDAARNVTFQRMKNNLWSTPRDVSTWTPQLERIDTSTKPPCAGQGTHALVKDRQAVRRRGGDRITFATIVTCPCCLDTNKGPVLSAKARLLPKPGWERLDT